MGIELDEQLIFYFLFSIFGGCHCRVGGLSIHNFIIFMLNFRMWLYRNICMVFLLDIYVCYSHGHFVLGLAIRVGVSTHRVSVSTHLANLVKKYVIIAS
jgi:hypothetical protein